MQISKRIINCCLILLLCNILFLWNTIPFPPPVKILAGIILVIYYCFINISPSKNKNLPTKLKILRGGCELILTTGVCTILQSFVYIYLKVVANYSFSLPVWIGSIVFNALLLSVLLANGVLRLFFSSSQITLLNRITILFFWWVPVLNIIIFCHIYKKAWREFQFNVLKYTRNRERNSQKVCKTKYPILLVHGIFFRDWKLRNYWGRIPKELTENGAAIYYGHQQSSSSIEDSAQELKDCILNIIEKEKCGKVNIIAHSKGGLDARYAISCLGMDQYTASLTTINTPHHGCRFARNALENIPPNLISSTAKKYNAIFSKLGDNQPDFFAGVIELTDEKCGLLNQNVTNCKGIYYQSIGSKMNSAKSAAFPLNLSYSIVNALDGENDGLVTVASMQWEAFTMIHTTSKQGISHGDVIDLTRKDIPGFDVCEFYVALIQGLKAKGL